MASKTVAIADHVAAMLSAVAVNVVRSYRPVFNLPQLDETWLSIVPGAFSSAVRTRSAKEGTATIAIGLQKRVSQVEADRTVEIDGLLETLENVADLLIGKPFEIVGIGVVTAYRTETDPMVSIENLAEQSVFTGVINVEFIYIA